MPETHASSIASSATLNIDGGLAGRRLDAALAELVPDMGVRARRRLIERGGVRLNGRRALAPGQTVRQGDVLELVAPGAAETRPSSPWGYPLKRPRVLADISPYVFLFKPAGLHTVALRGGSAPSLEALLPEIQPGTPLRLLQRLDFETSGLVCAAASPEAEEAFRRAERQDEIRKDYIALLLGGLEKSVTVRASIDMDGGATVRVRDAEGEPGRHTCFAPLVRWQAPEAAAVAQALGMPDPKRELTLAACRIGRGARHQIRAHAAWLGLPLWGDARYGGGSAPCFFLHHGRFHMAAAQCRCLPPWLSALAETPGGASAAVRRWLDAPVSAEIF